MDSNLVTTSRLLDRSVNNLLNDFGAGNSAPGSGSAAALMGILAGKLITTVCSLSIKKSEQEKLGIDNGSIKSNQLKYIQFENQFRFIIEDIQNNIEPQLKLLFEEDSREFEKVVKLRKQRIQAENESNKELQSKYNKESLDKLQQVTDFVFQISEQCFKLIDHGNFIFDKAYTAVRGDSGAAISAAIAGVTSSIFIINLNLVSLSRRNWSKEKKKACDDIYEKLQIKQLEAFSRVGALSSEVVETMQIKMDDI
ncbi:cyclodeaminase/cyclohydrolase family protein [Aliiglaciecola sp. M165]|uniref:cyclodeaminase/cyclohydrolase family protein n=1 Tax=Aliiglaciecola sp. M165 TaxID=2593649 RepID=UPI00117D9677|nr:cyclodeaminase/cyclohydrolase family protein [Aliiglaciecola sp. M165]TRY29777.1 cyclodeaminase/cyclohydrolase family protein [Aliiglaciecola sp. M165]